MRLTLWVILWRGGLGALDLVGLEMLLVVEVEVLRGVVEGRVEVVTLYDGGWVCVTIMVGIVCRRWSHCTSINKHLTPSSLPIECLILNGYLDLRTNIPGPTAVEPIILSIPLDINIILLAEITISLAC